MFLKVKFWIYTLWLISPRPSSLLPTRDLMFLYLFPRPVSFPHIKTVYVWPCHRVMDCIVLRKKKEKGGWGGEEGGKNEWERKNSSEGHGSLVLAKKTVPNTCSCLQRPFNLLITCQSITRQPDQMSSAARTRTARERGRGWQWKTEGTDCTSGRAENEDVKKSICAYISMICWWLGVNFVQGAVI